MIWLRAGVYIDRWRGTTARIYSRRPWESINLAEILSPGVPNDPANYAAFKREQSTPFLFPLGKPPEIPATIRGSTAERHPPLKERLDLLAQMRPVYFFDEPSPKPVDWNANPFDHTRSDPTKPWYELIKFIPEQGDMRVMWEPSRAAWALDLARARSHGHDIEAGDLLWRWIDSWMDACVPFMGFQWGCGQESSIRFLAVALGVWGLADNRSMTPARWTQLARLAWATGYRVAHHINYAISQKNNHSLSEAMGLLLIAHLFPEFKQSGEWWEKGRYVLDREIRRQLAADGTYVQMSMNYERVMLQICTMSLRLAELAGRAFDRAIYDMLGRGCDFLFECMEPTSGRMPNYGSNDGAYVLPLSECDFNDFRPALQAGHYLVHRQKLFGSGPWDEDLLWLFGQEALASPEPAAREPVSSRFDDGGYYTLRQNESWMMTRCHTYRDRVHHIDPLHLDLWWRGQNVLMDCGSYHYYTPENPELDYHFKSIAAHNTVEIDGTDPLTLVSRFLWLPWYRSSVRHFQAEQGKPLMFEGEHYAYDRAPWHVVHRRAILGLPGDVWVVIDDILGRAATVQASWRWHLPDAPYTQEADGPATMRLDTPKGPVTIAFANHRDTRPTVEVIRGVEQPGRVQGWSSTYYGERRPIPTLEVGLKGTLPYRMITLFALGASQASVSPKSAAGNDWAIQAGASSWTVSLAAPERESPRTVLGVEPA